MVGCAALQEYEGEYSCDKKHGHGRYSWPSGAHFCGHFDNDRREGAGVYVSPEGEKFEVVCTNTLPLLVGNSVCLLLIPSGCVSPGHA